MTFSLNNISLARDLYSFEPQQHPFTQESLRLLCSFLTLFLAAVELSNLNLICFCLLSTYMWPLCHTNCPRATRARGQPVAPGQTSWRLAAVRAISLHQRLGFMPTLLPIKILDTVSISWVLSKENYRNRRSARDLWNPFLYFSEFLRNPPQ